uniref:Uncharacterized protein n=1 Tax=viral metagenome TaxID=1070528 RepID=A0A6M3JH56_9ZZZZ
MIYLAVDHGCYEGWRLMECETAEEAIEYVKRGETYSMPWKIFKELMVTVEKEGL